jgi:hypothetical protein
MRRSTRDREQKGASRSLEIRLWRPAFRGAGEDYVIARAFVIPLMNVRSAL